MPANLPEGGIRLSTAPSDMRKSFDGLAGAGSQPARRGPRLGRPAHIHQQPARDDEDAGLRAGRLPDPGRRPEQGHFALPAGPRGASFALSRTDLQAPPGGVDFAANIGLKKLRAKTILGEVAYSVGNWHKFADTAGVEGGDAARIEKTFRSNLVLGFFKSAA